MNSNSKQTKTESPQANKALDNSFRAPEARSYSMPLVASIEESMVLLTGMSSTIRTFDLRGVSVLILSLINLSRYLIKNDIIIIFLMQMDNYNYVW